MSVELSNGYEVGSHASYECNEPLEGNDQCSTRVCLPDGTWNGEEPTCEGDSNASLVIHASALYSICTHAHTNRTCVDT